MCRTSSQKRPCRPPFSSQLKLYSKETSRSLIPTAFGHMHNTSTSFVNVDESLEFRSGTSHICVLVHNVDE